MAKATTKKPSGKKIRTYKVEDEVYYAAMQNCRIESAEKGMPITLAGKIEEYVRKIAKS